MLGYPDSTAREFRAYFPLLGRLMHLFASVDARLRFLAFALLFLKFFLFFANVFRFFRLRFISSGGARAAPRRTSHTPAPALRARSNTRPATTTVAAILSTRLPAS